MQTQLTSLLMISQIETQKRQKKHKGHPTPLLPLLVWLAVRGFEVEPAGRAHLVSGMTGEAERDLEVPPPTVELPQPWRRRPTRSRTEDISEAKQET